MDKTEKVILVTGATGRQGGAVTRHLLNSGWKVRALTRDPSKPQAVELRDLGVEIVSGDLSDPSSLVGPLSNVYGVFSVQNPWEHGVDEEERQGKALADAAKAAGVRHFVYSSVGSANQHTGIPHFESKFRIEEYIKSLGIRWTILRPVWFMENLLGPQFSGSIYNGVLPLALDPDTTLQMISVDDIGAFAALVFDDPDTWIGKAIDLAGDELTGVEMAEVFSGALGSEVRFKELPIEELQDSSGDYAMMFDWFNLRGYSADIEQLRKLLPGLHDFETWVGKSGWHRAAA